MRIAVLLPLIVLILFGGPIATAQVASPKSESLVRFDWNCSSSSAYPKKSLNRIVLQTMNQENFSGFGTWGDRAFAFDLNGDRRNEYFVPLDCGGTGNCAWALFALKPLRRLAILRGQYIYVQTHRGHWPDVVVYAHVSAVEGLLTTFHFKKDRYIEKSPGLPINHGESGLDVQGGAGNKLPESLDQAKPACSTPGT